MYVTFQYNVISDLCNALVLAMRGRNNTTFVRARLSITQAVLLRCFEHRQGTDNESPEPGCTLIVLHVRTMILLLNSTDI